MGAIWSDVAAIWSDDNIGASVYVNGGFVEISLADEWSGRLTPAQAVDFMAKLTTAVAEAASLASRWDAVSRTYRELP